MQERPRRASPRPRPESGSRERGLWLPLTNIGRPWLAKWVEFPQRARQVGVVRRGKAWYVWWSLDTHHAVPVVRMEPSMAVRLRQHDAAERPRGTSIPRVKKHGLLPLSRPPKSVELYALFS